MSRESATSSLIKSDINKQTPSPILSTFKFLFPLSYKVPSLLTDVIIKLKGQVNYEEWSAHIGLMIEAIGAHRIVYEGQTLDKKADDEEKLLYRVIYSQAKLLIINLVKREIISTIIKLPTCHEI